MAERLRATDQFVVSKHLGQGLRKDRVDRRGEAVWLIDRRAVYSNSGGTLRRLAELGRSLG